MVVLEVAGALFGIFMIYMTYVSFKKKQLNKNDFIVWAIIWLGVIIFAVFSQQLQPSIRLIGLVRLFDLTLIIGFAILFGVIFFMFRKIRVLERKIDELVGKIILKKR